MLYAKISIQGHCQAHRGEKTHMVHRILQRIRKALSDQKLTRPVLCLEIGDPSRTTTVCMNLSGQN
jgi:hypothetical protein